MLASCEQFVNSLQNICKLLCVTSTLCTVLPRYKVTRRVRACAINAPHKNLHKSNIMQIHQRVSLHLECMLYFLATVDPFGVTSIYLGEIEFEPGLVGIPKRKFPQNSPGSPDAHGSMKEVRLLRVLVEMTAKRKQWSTMGTRGARERCPHDDLMELLVKEGFLPISGDHAQVFGPHLYLYRLRLERPQISSVADHSYLKYTKGKFIRSDMPYTATHPNRALLNNIIRGHSGNGYNSTFRGKAADGILTDTTVSDATIDSWCADAQVANTDALWEELRDAIVPPPAQTAPAGPLRGSTGLSGSSSHSGEAKLDKILEMMIEDRQERKSIPFSKITAGKITDALEGHIYRKPEVFKTDRDRIKSKVDPFTWITGRASSETAQTPEVLKWFQRNIKPVGGFKWRDMSQGVSMRLPIGGWYCQNSIIADITVDYVFKGKTDLQLSEGDEVDTAIMIVQLKKNIMCQIETLAACRLSMYPVVGVLTDTENWVFYWMGSQNILNYHKLEGTIGGVNLALSVIHNFVEVQERQESGDDIPFTFPPRISKEHMDRNMDLLPDLDICDQMAVFRDYYEKQLSHYT
ncbi:hypothetical protein PROFUN_12500 [Planoprotostelium fungivorum]|uniref:Uncharacterized protein n=1 Tax=Planoprotostelium fungivorum TaxID=1890364 RepID=A0A2P6N7A0_9EUKA|nr:hypothetical protein PROFUN_12500 [Planoprotostelium fungivorum]